MRKDQPQTLFTRMLATYLTVTLGMLLLSGVTVATLLRGYYLRDKREQMTQELAIISQLCQNEARSLSFSDGTEHELNLIARHYGACIRIISADGGEKSYYTDSKWGETAATRYTFDQINSMLYASNRYDAAKPNFSTQNGTMRVLTATQPILADGVPIGLAVISLDNTAMQTSMGMMYLEVILVCLIAILIAVIAVYYTTSMMTRPFMEINDIVQQYSKGDYNIRIPVSSTSEASQLAVSFNSMADQLKDLEATRRSFVANVSHELRSPLTSMRGFLEAMQDGTIGEEDYEKYIGIVLSETRRMSGMVNDLLDLARIESGRTALKLELFDINELIRRTLITFEARIYEKAMEVDVKFAQEQYYVEADSAQISQVLRNIIDNAIKYSPDGARLRIATYAMRREIYVSIQDSGPGVPEEDIPHVFDRFYKVEKAHTPTKQSGTGLGLSIVKRIIDQHGQTITLNSGKGKGCTFTFTLKRAPAQKRAQDGGK